MGLGGISIWQLLIILAIVIMLFGTKRLRGLGSDLGGAIKGFKKSMQDEDAATGSAEEEERTGDAQVLEVIQPFFVFRGLVIASPEWYPDHPAPVRRGLMNLIANVLEDAVFDWEHVGKYME